MPPASVSSKYTRTGHVKPGWAAGSGEIMFIRGILPERVWQSRVVNGVALRPGSRDVAMMEK
ncbi:unnamed protein product [Mycetohabitans rhizoxinica HKI 454]|uniref:Uncharacterized protein n=1 Tax=Mycetohabitans rhizoxinica (strain DSM 19002 / CIP 109453 / HKI 454) TaxID=882378 RepID=E5ASH1_MYCRK|nr:unnamed protein product [Mycetohabitans rhizoxinica HKI 454]